MHSGLLHLTLNDIKSCICNLYSDLEYFHIILFTILCYAVFYYNGMKLKKNKVNEFRYELTNVHVIKLKDSIAITTVIQKTDLRNQYR